MERAQIFPEFGAAFELLGVRWNGLVVYSLLEGPKRFKEMSSMLPAISHTVLAKRLKILESAAVVVRHVYPETPVLIKYELTNKGYALKPVIVSIKKWCCSRCPLLGKCDMALSQTSTSGAPHDKALSSKRD